MSEPRYARDMTRVMRHKGKLWNISDFSLAGIGGVSLQAGGIALALGAITGLFLAVIGSLLLAIPFLMTFIGVGLVTGFVTYAVLSRNRGGKEQPLDQFKLWFASRRRDPGIVQGARRDDQPHHLRWVAIAWRPDWANVDVTSRPHTRAYNPQPVGDDSVISKPRTASATFEDLLS